jgi:hypothetical protein
MDRITAIEKSLAAFVCGIFGFIPFLGLPPAVYALVCWGKIRRQYREEWNPARNYLRLGTTLALLGILDSALILAIMAVAFL